MKILAIESSCDETACAIVEDGIKIISNVVASSKKLHHKYGGIMPELAAREQLSSILPVIQEALKILPQEKNVIKTISKHIDAIAITIGPGLIGSLLVGVETAKTMAMLTGVPIIPVNHVIAHMYANFIDSHQSSVTRLAGVSAKRVSHQKNTNYNLKAENRKLIAFPAISLVVSGGHTELYLMKSPNKLTWLGGTLDDAAGECFDKTARLLGFGNEGGVAIAKAAKWHHPSKKPSIIKLPRPMLDEKNEYNFSFSGLKSAIVRLVTTLKEQTSDQSLTPDVIANLSYETQDAITDVLVKKTLNAAAKHHAKSILLSGGVAANMRLREKFLVFSPQFSVVVPPVSLCTDNAVYIASCAFFLGNPTPWQEITAAPDLSVEL